MVGMADPNTGLAYRSISLSIEASGCLQFRLHFEQHCYSNMGFDQCTFNLGPNLSILRVREESTTIFGGSDNSPTQLIRLLSVTSMSPYVIPVIPVWYRYPVVSSAK